jgi:hypothetical protein
MREATMAWLIVATLAVSGCAAPAAVGLNPPLPAPPLLAETVPKPPVSEDPLIWQPGHWEWSGGSYVWSAGLWVKREGHGTNWQDGYWAPGPTGGWVWVPAHWV